MPANEIHGAGNDGTSGEHVQVFLYRVPKANHDAFGRVEPKLAAIFRRHGMVRSDFFVLGAGRVFRGFRGVRSALEATDEEEVWMELDTYRDAEISLRGHRGDRKDAEAGPLFG